MLEKPDVDEEEVLTPEEQRIRDLVQKYPRPASFDSIDGKNPEERANYFSTWVFTFISDLILLGYRRPLMLSDLWAIHADDNVNRVAPMLHDEWHNQVNLTAQVNARMREEDNAKLASGQINAPRPPMVPSVFSAVVSYSRSTIGWLLFYQLIVRAESIASPFVLRQVLEWLVYMPAILKPEEEHMGYIYILILFLMSTLSNLCNNRFFYIGYHNYAQIKSGLNGLLYSKSLRTGFLSEDSGASEKDKKAEARVAAGDDKKGPAPPKKLGGTSSSAQSTGQIVNMMAVDTDKIALVFFFGLNIVFVPFQLAILIYFIYDCIGKSIFAGLGVIFVVVPIAAFCAAMVGNFMRKKMIFADKRVKFTNEILTGIRAIKFYAWERFFAKELEVTRTSEVEVIQLMMVFTSVMGLLFTLIQPLITVVTILVYNALGNDIQENAIDVFQAVAFINALQAPLMQLPNSLSTIIFGLISSARISLYLNLPELDRMKDVSVKDVEDNSEEEYKPMEGDHAVVIKNASFAWESINLPPMGPPGRGGPPAKGGAPPAAAVAKPKGPVKVLTDINLSIPRGKITAIIGSVGSGKSSLVHAILDEMKLLSGECQKDENMPIAYVSQSAWIQTKTIKENIIFGDTLDTEEKIARYNNTLDVCALRPDLDILECGDETSVGDRGVNLSGGQKQRISLCRAVYAGKDTYCFDDVMSALDSNVAEHVFSKCIVEELKGKTRILITNQLHVLPRCDYICVLKTVDDDTNDAVSVASVPIDIPTESNNTGGDIPLAVLSPVGSVDAQSKRQVGTIAEFGTYAELMEKEDSTLKELVNNYFNYLETGNKEEALGLEGIFDDKKVAEVAKDDDSEDSVEQIDEEEGLLDPEMENNYERSIIHSLSQRVIGERNAQEKGVYVTNKQLIGGKLAKGKQISDEEMSTGTVGLKVYLYHLNTMGVACVILLIMSAVLAQASTVGLSLMLTYWADDQFNQDDNFYLHGYVALLGLMFFFNIIRTIVFSQGCVNSSRYYHEKLIKNVLVASSVFYDTTPTGRILNRFSKDIDNIDVAIPNMLLHSMSIMLMLLGSIIVVCINQPYFVIAAVVIIIMFLLLQSYYSPAAIQLQRLESVTRSPYIQSYGETLKGITTIRAFHKAKEFQKNQFVLFNTNSCALCSVRTVYRYGALRVGAIQSLMLLVAGLIVCLQRKSTDIGSGSLILTMSMGIGNILGFLVMMLIELQSNFNSVERLQHYTYNIPLERELDYGVDDFNPPEDWPQNGTLEYDNVFMRYRPELPQVLHGLSFKIQGGKKVGVVGRTGSGKSTLLMLLPQLYNVESGTIRIDDVDISKVALHRLRNSIGIVPQDPVLFSGTVRANLDPFGQYTDEAVRHALEAVNLLQVVMSLDDGLLHKVSEYGSNFSQGQRQLLCIARMILKKPRILLLDEATSSVDAETDSSIQRAFDEGFTQTTKLIIAHRLNTVISADYILLLDNGKLLEFGTPDELINATSVPQFIEKDDQPTPTITDGTFAKMYQTYLSNSQ